MKRFPMRWRGAAKSLLAYGLLTVSTVIFSQSMPAPVLQNVVHLSAQGALEVEQDLLSIAMSTTRDGSDPALVQSQLTSAIDAALVQARKVAQPGQLEVRSGNFSLYPRYGRDGKSIGWQGTAELILEGRDFALISATAARMPALSVGSVNFGLSRAQRAKVEGEAQSMAIERFKARAADVARSFGFGGYTLREVNVSASDSGPTPRPQMMAMQARAAESQAPVPVEAGKSTVAVTVSGSVQLK